MVNCTHAACDHGKMDEYAWGSLIGHRWECVAHGCNDCGTPAVYSTGTHWYCVACWLRDVWKVSA